METMTSAEPAAVPAARLGFNEALGRTWNLYRRSWKRLTFLILLSVACIMVLLLGTAMLDQAFRPSLAENFEIRDAAEVILWFVTSIAMFVLQAWFWTAYLRIVDHPTLGVRAALHEGRKYAWPFLWTSLLSALALLGGSVLIIPAIVWSVAFSMLGWVTVLEGRTGLDALVRARQLAYGDGWWLFGMQLGAGLIVSGIAYIFQWTINVFASQDLIKEALNLGSFIVQTLLITPLFTVFLYVLYKDLLESKKGRLAALPDTRRHFQWALMAAFGLCVIATFVGFWVRTIEK